MPGISDLLHSDVESETNFVDENSLISSTSDTISIAPSKAPAKKAKKRKCVTMPKKPRATKVSVKTDPDQPPQAAGAKRKAKAIDVTVDEDDLVEVEAPKAKSKGSKSTKDQEASRSTTKPSKVKQTKKAVAADTVEAEDAVPSPAAARSNFASTKATKALPRPVTDGKVKSTSVRAQKAIARVTENTISDPEDDDIEMVEQQPPRKKARTESRPRQEPSYRRRAGSVSDTERGDPLLRRKLGDITRKYENVDAKYRNLKEIAISEANSNFEKLRKEHDQIIETNHKLVSSLKQQLAQQAPIIQEYQKSKKDVSSHESETKKLQAAQSELSNSLAAAQNEIKSLKAKLAAAKAAPPSVAAPVEPKLPAPTHKAALSSNKAITGTTNEAVQKFQLKLDLYSDLTGLIIRDVRQTEDGETFDCIQTGRDGRKFLKHFYPTSPLLTCVLGALHFKLFIDAEEAKKSNPNEQEFLYTPLLDSGRDRDLIEIMPSYLTEDITFARDVASRFYGRVVETVMRRVDDRGEEDDGEDGDGEE